ncbi:hypothetical protein FF011L_30510 [Roseimaritima multifibrata]|uniref:Uncharacterized protein n=1 Tax=Roseimaritima multifibrata TaxID=1930274 RepID=A0A517MHB7_9BACT|nr:hypothetical protein FF011L_30510 [Roseimaritima multifibrata]
MQRGIYGVCLAAITLTRPLYPAEGGHGDVSDVKSPVGSNRYNRLRMMGGATSNGAFSKPLQDQIGRLVDLRVSSAGVVEQPQLPRR